MSSYLEPPTRLEALLRDACRRALGLGLSFTNQIRLYRSILALAREVRLRIGGRGLDIGNDTLAVLLASVSEHASAVGADPELPLPDAILLHRLAVQLSRAARLADGADARVRDFLAQDPMHRENPPPCEETRAHERIEARQNSAHREKSSRPEAALEVLSSDDGFGAQKAMHRENAPQRKPFPEQDDSLPAWRDDRYAERNQRVREPLRGMFDERVAA